MFPEALQVIRQLTGQDLTTHRPRFVLDFRLEDFDYIIGMDSSVFMRLSAMPQVPKDKLYGWEIAIPAGWVSTPTNGPRPRSRTYLEQFLLNREMEKGSAPQSLTVTRPAAQETAHDGEDLVDVAVENQLRPDQRIPDSGFQQKLQNQHLVPGRTAPDPADLPGLDRAVDLRAGSDQQQPVGFDIARVFPDDDGPARELRPQLRLAVLDHIEPVKEDAVAAARRNRARRSGSGSDPCDFSTRMGWTSQSVVLPMASARVMSPRDVDAGQVERAVAALLGLDQMPDRARIEMQKAGADDVVGQGIIGQDDQAEWTARAR